MFLPGLPHWHDVRLPDRGTICILDARCADASAAIHIQDELKYQAADMIFFLDDGQVGGAREKHSLNDWLGYPTWNKTPEPSTKIIEIILPPISEGAASGQASLIPFRLEPSPITCCGGRSFPGYFEIGPCQP